MPTDNKPILDSLSEITQITEEEHSANAVFNDKNKTLALLRKIETIILTSVTDLNQIAREVSDLLVEEEFKFVELFILSESILKPLAISTSDNNEIVNKYGLDRFLTPPLSMIDRDNLLVRTLIHNNLHYTDNLKNVFTKSISQEEALQIQKDLGIKTAVVYPLKVRADVIGVMVIGITEEKDKISEDLKVLIDRLAGFVGIALDNAWLYQSMQEANTRLKQVDHLKDEFVSLASHELRTPMTIIKSYLWMFLDKKGKDLTVKEREYLERAYISAERLIKLVNDMLNVSRIESGRLKLEMKDIDVVSLTSTVVTELAPRGVELGIKIEFIKPVGEVKKVNGDSDRIEQILMNLIGNSLKFTPRGGKITVTLEPEDIDVLISVADTGRGINNEDFPKLFQKFGMIGSAYLQKQRYQGSGLGLYLCKSLVQLHGGDISVESEGDGKGAKFSFTLPYNEDKPHREAEVLPQSIGTSAVGTPEITSGTFSPVAK